MRKPWVAVLLLSAVGLAAAPWFSRLACDLIAPRVAQKLAITLPEPRSASPALRTDLEMIEVANALTEGLEDDPTGREASVAEASKPRSSRAAGGILVRRSATRAAARSGIRPTAVAVPATNDHPAGLLVTGWGGAGTALRDGDIITRVGGATPRSPSDVIAVVVAAYRKKIYVVSGQIWRNGTLLSATVELPYPTRPER